jgi:hypothetical protein
MLVKRGCDGSAELIEAGGALLICLARVSMRPDPVWS